MTSDPAIPDLAALARQPVAGSQQPSPEAERLADIRLVREALRRILRACTDLTDHRQRAHVLRAAISLGRLASAPRTPSPRWLYHEASDATPGDSRRPSHAPSSPLITRSPAPAPDADAPKTGPEGPAFTDDAAAPLLSRSARTTGSAPRPHSQATSCSPIAPPRGAAQDSGHRTQDKPDSPAGLLARAGLAIGASRSPCVRPADRYIESRPLPRRTACTARPSLSSASTDAGDSLTSSGFVAIPER